MKNSRCCEGLLLPLIGVIGGIVATGPMTVAMILMHRRLPRHERYPLPPREITMKLARDAGVQDELSETSRSALTLVSHFAYGAACGGVYGAAVDRVPGPAALKGAAMGLLVWGASYLGWLPAAGVLTPATEHPGRRNSLMIAAHLVWGVVLAVFVNVLQGETSESGSRPLTQAGAPLRDTGDATARS